ncbi:MAG TPA: cupin domain-containing protein [Blastocatellia bacterium]|nr:cupin domain-containing protein [Blastocatellia bacterium]
MTHRVADDQIRGQAALYALGALDEDDARAFAAHLEEGCKVCREEVEGFAVVSSSLGYGAKPTEPPRRVREALISRIAAAGRLLSIKAGQGEWEEMMEGVFVKTLHVDRSRGIRTSLVRMLPGTTLPAHRHIGVEQFYVLEGDCSVHGEMLRPGDFHIADSNTIHESTSTVSGTTFLLIGPEAYEFLQPGK